ncbi:tryptophan synthase subunit alpha, partial [Microbacterium sp. SUBG005]
MTANDDNLRRRASLELLRAEASDELAVLIHERLRGGEDPWDFMEDLPSVDELVLTLRAENIAENGGVRPNKARNYRVLRQIALDYPALTRAVWRILGA